MIRRTLRSSAKNLDSRLEVTSRFYNQLRRKGCLDTEELNSIGDSPLQTLTKFEVDNLDFKIPFITALLPRKKIKTCIICTESYHEVAFKSEGGWKLAFQGFEGPWMYEIFSFPFRVALGCAHEMNTCKTCLANQIASQLEQHGVQACGRISCPTCRVSRD